jgi:hypothetical protein
VEPDSQIAPVKMKGVSVIRKIADVGAYHRRIGVVPEVEAKSAPEAEGMRTRGGKTRFSGKHLVLMRVEL